MKSSLKNTFLVVTATLLCLFLAWFYARNKALSEPLRDPIQHAFLQKPLTQIAYGGIVDETAAPNSLPALEKAAQIGEQVILWVDITPNPAGDLVLSKDYVPSGALSLKDALQKFPNNRFVLNFHHNRPGAMEKLMEAVDEAKAGDRLLIQSPEEGILKELREKRALWLYGSSQARVTQLKMLSSLWLEPMAPLKGDVLVVEWPKYGSRRINESIVNEAHRRKMRVLVGPTNSPEDARTLREQGVDGVMTSDNSTLVDQAAR